MAILTSYSLVPELQSAFSRFILNAEMNREQLPNPVDIPDLYLTPNSFITMLFKDDYNQPDYSYLYVDEINPFFIPRIAYSRIQIYPAASKYLIMDSTGDNIFHLQQDDFTMLDSLLVYRNDSTALTMIDTTTTTTLVTDTTSDIAVLFTDYDNLGTVLSKLIYLYLDLQINDRFERYNNMQIVSHGTMLETCYEAYLTEQFYWYMLQNKPDLKINYNEYCEDPNG